MLAVTFPFTGVPAVALPGPGGVLDGDWPANPFAAPLFVFAAVAGFVAAGGFALGVNSATAFVDGCGGTTTAGGIGCVDGAVGLPPGGGVTA
jgi:hypothetical protein